MVFGVPVAYDRWARESLKRIVNQAAHEAGFGKLVPATMGRVTDAQGCNFDVEDAHRQHLLNV